MSFYYRSDVLIAMKFIVRFTDSRADITEKSTHQVSLDIKKWAFYSSALKKRHILLNHRTVLSLMKKDETRAKEKMADILPHCLYYESKIHSVRWLNRKRIEHCLDLAGDMEGKRILDAGTGDGYMLQQIKCGELWGVDISSKRLERAAKKAPYAILKQDDLNQSLFESNFFDGIICADVLEHMRAPANAIREMIRICKPDGFIIICLPQEINNILARMMLWKRPIINPDHYHLVTGFFLQREFKIRPSRVKNIPDVPHAFCMHRVMRYDMARYGGCKPYSP